MPQYRCIFHYKKNFSLLEKSMFLLSLRLSIGAIGYVGHATAHNRKEHSPARSLHHSLHHHGRLQSWRFRKTSGAATSASAANALRDFFVFGCMACHLCHCTATAPKDAATIFKPSEVVFRDAILLADLSTKLYHNNQCVQTKEQVHQVV